MRASPPGRPLGGMAVPYKGFSRFRVLDFSKLLPGPYATQMLADMGCRVTRVELPHFGDLLREVPPRIQGVGYAYWMLNQGKRRLVLDFRRPAGLARLRGLVAAADVLVEGFRPGLMERIGLGYPELSRLNPRLVYCSISGYPPQGPWGRRAGHDLNFQAASGLLGLGDSEGRASFSALQAGDVAGSMAAVSAVLAALLERETTRRGRHVRVSLAQALHSWLAIPLGYLAATGQDPGGRPRWWSGASPFYRLYAAKDGGKLAVAAVEKGFAVSLLDELGLTRHRDLADDPAGNARRLARLLAAAFRTRTAAEWARRLEGRECCVTAVRGLKAAAALMRGLQSAVPGAAPSRTRAGRSSRSARTRG